MVAVAFATGVLRNPLTEPVMRWVAGTLGGEVFLGATLMRPRGLSGEAWTPRVGHSIIGILAVAEKHCCAI